MYGGTPFKSPRKESSIDDGPIVELCTVVNTLPAERWQDRCGALQRLVALIPSNPSSRPLAWYNSAKHLRHLAGPLGELLKDPRSSVVKRSCEYVLEIFRKCQVDARYLLKDLMPTILAVHAQTVQVIRTYVQAMVAEALPLVPCKATMPLWLEKLKMDKSRTVREACAFYLCVALQSWTDEGYLTLDIWSQVGTSLIRAVRDPSPSVRTQAKQGLEQLRQAQPDVWNKLLHDPSGPVANDPSIQKWLLRVSSGEQAEDLSVVSRGSQASSSHHQQHRDMQRSSDHSSTTRPSVRPIPSAVVVGGTTTATATNGSSRSVTNTSSRRTGLGPPIRLNTAFNYTNAPDFAGRAMVEKTSSTPLQRNKVVSRHASRDTTTNLELTPTSQRLQQRLRGDKVAASPRLSDRSLISQKSDFLMSPSDISEKSQEEVPPLVPEDDDNRSFLIASGNDLQQHAKGRRSRRSSLLQKRWRLSSSKSMSSSSSLLVDVESPTIVPPIANEKSVASPVANEWMEMPEHIQIAQQLLVAHRNHVDQVMETLRLEMDAMRDFELLLLDDRKPNQPTEDEVLDYFESVGLCLDQRTSSGKELQREMDRISKGGS